MADLEIRGADKLGALAKALRQAGDKELQKELYAGLNRSTKPLKEAAKKSAAQRLPQRGGLSKRVAKARFSTRRKGGRNAGVQIVAKGLDQLKRMDERGEVKHPVYGNQRVWVTQDIDEARGWFTKPMQDGAPAVRRELVKSLDKLARKVARKY